MLTNYFAASLRRVTSKGSKVAQTKSGSKRTFQSTILAPMLVSGIVPEA